MLRIPLLPVDFYASLGARGDSVESLVSAVEDPKVRAALVVGSPAVIEALERAGDVEPDSRLARTLHNYLVRMSTRPTPYGLFAGVALVSRGDRTDVEVSTLSARTRTRPDMKWLLGLVAALEAVPAVKQHLCYIANPRLVEHAGRVFVPAERRGDDLPDIGSAISLRASTTVRRALALARTPVAHPQLLADLLAFTGAPRADVEQLIEQLWARGALLTDLRPPLTNHDPARYVSARLANIAAAGQEATLLRRALAAMVDWDEDTGPDRDAAYRRLVEVARISEAAWAVEPPQVDMVVPLTGRKIHRKVASDAARAAELLLRLSAEPRRMSHLASYRTRFEARYGVNRPVRVLEVLDPNLGLGSPYLQEPPVVAARHSGDRDELLLRLASDALRDGNSVITLDEVILAQIFTPVTPAKAPRSLEVSTFVLANSAADLDAGDYLIVVGPNLGARSAGRTLGRFADLLGAPAIAALSDTHAVETTLKPGVVFAELVYLPHDDRLANVIVRHHSRDYEIAVGLTAGVPADRAIPLDELYVESTGERFRLRWSRLDVEVVVTSGHMLNSRSAPDVCRFLSELDDHGNVFFGRFDWGDAALLPALPRVQVGRIVLCPARYRDTEQLRTAAKTDSPAAFADAVTLWRRRWRVPRYIYAGTLDNRLLVDLDSAFHLNGFRLELRRLRDGRRLTIEEALPNPNHAWLSGPGGRYLSELAIPLVRTVADSPPSPWAAPIRALSPSDVLRPPGSDWLYAKLYCSQSAEDDVLLETSQHFCREMLGAGLADRWFFIRFADPDPHLRLRLHGEPSVLIGTVAQKLCEWSSRLIERGLCERISFDTYEREVERYGGTEGIEIAEEIFAADSAAVVAITGLRRAGVLSTNPIVLAAFTGFDLLETLGYRACDVLRWCRATSSTRQVSDPERRDHVRELREILSQGPRADEQHDLGVVLSARRDALAGMGERLDSLGPPERPDRNGMLGAYLHMHCNRLLGRDRDNEFRALATLAQTLYGLSVAPPSAAHRARWAVATAVTDIPGRRACTP